jgi:hypothetical protein
VGGSKMKTQNYYIVLTGAKKNVGDYLITERAIKLLEYVLPDYNFIKQPHWESFDDIDFINKSKGIIILGGPGYQQNMYPGVYKLSENLSDITVPIHILGSGWKGKPGDKTTEKLYKFTETSVSFLKKVNSTKAGMSCRDKQTLRVLNRNGFENVTMTGCPVWYDLPSLGKKFIVPKNISKIVFTPAQDAIYFEQNIEIMNYFKSSYPDIEIIVSFHRGIGNMDEFTPEKDIENNTKIAQYAKKLNYTVVDTSFDTKKLEFYEECDIHIGYRVHAHIYFLSKRLPSILIHEDGRGNGVTEALSSPGIDAYKVSRIYSTTFRIFNKSRFAGKVYQKLGIKLNKKIIHELDNVLNNIKENDYNIYNDVASIIDNQYQIMESYIKRIPREKEVL